MKTRIIIIFSIILMACSQKSDVVGIKVGEEYFTLDQAAKEAIVNERSEEKLICKKTQITGSHFKTKRCTTKSQAERDRENADQILQTKDTLNNRVRTAEAGDGQ